MAEIVHSGWQVAAIDPAAYVTTASGELQYGARVQFVTGAGNRGSVFVSNTELTPAKVGALINQQAAVMDALANLAAGPMGMGA